MSTRITVEHDGKEYGGQIGVIKSTALGFEDHGILTAWLHIEFKGGGIGVGGYCLDDKPETPGGERKGTAYGLDHVIRIVETVGAGKWEDLPGKQVIVLYSRVEGSYLGSRSVGIASTTGDRVLVLADHAESWKLRAKAVTA